MQYSNVNPLTISTLAEIISKINPVELVTPVNVDDEKKRWIKIAKNGFFIDPYFQYNRQLLTEVANYRPILRQGRAHLETHLIPETAAERVILDILLNRINQAITCTDLAVVTLLGDRAEAKNRNINLLIYGAPNSTQVLKAYDIVEKNTEPEDIAPRFTDEERKALKKMKFYATDIDYWFTEVINKYGFEGWGVEIGKQHTAIDVRDKNSSGQPLVGIPEDRKVNGLELLQLVGHELECHLRGSANCKALIEKILGANSVLAPLFSVIAKSDDELFYEGVAKISDVSVNGSEALPLPYATIACNQARNGDSFATIARIIRNYRLDMGESEEDAVKHSWTTTYRIMRGSANPAVGGYYFSKDYVYMAGYDIAKEINPEWYNYASMTIEEIRAIAATTDISEPKYRNLDAVGWLKDQLLSNNAG